MTTVLKHEKTTVGSDGSISLPAHIFRDCLLAKVTYTVSLEFPARAVAEEQSTYEIEPEEATARELKPRRPSVQESGRRE